MKKLENKDNLLYISIYLILLVLIYLTFGIDTALAMENGDLELESVENVLLDNETRQQDNIAEPTLLDRLFCENINNDQFQILFICYATGMIITSFGFMYFIGLDIYKTPIFRW